MASDDHFLGDLHRTLGKYADETSIDFSDTKFRKPEYNRIPQA